MEPNQPSLKIGLAFSGGGYRAACFGLGTLSYLEKLTINNTTLLQHVIALSTVSGGTITGAGYAIGIKQQQDFLSIYKHLYDFMKNTDLAKLSLDHLLQDKHWNSERIRSLINCFADIYDRELFHGARFGALMTDEHPIHLKHMSFNAADFSNGLQFRFQWSPPIPNPKEGEPPRGLIGNYFIQIPEEAAAEIRMGDVLAASSCFPGGFEPINFPNDFIQQDTPNLKDLLTNPEMPEFPVGLMDGGIVDNQGIVPLLLAESRMKDKEEVDGPREKNLDLVIFADVASPYMEDYVASQQKPARWWRALTPLAILTINSIILITSILGMIWSYQWGNMTVLIASTAIATTSLFVYVLGAWIKALPKRFDVPDHFMAPLSTFLRLRLQIYETLIKNRKNSMLKLINEVFLKHIRRLNYNVIYQDKKWKNRRIMTAIYELRPSEEHMTKKITEEKLPGFMLPSTAVQKAAATAAAMGTTLWFTPDELQRKNMLNTLIACGQFTLCWNLLEYVIKVKANPENTGPQHQLLLDLEGTLRMDWETFKTNPYYYVDELNKKNKPK